MRRRRFWDWSRKLSSDLRGDWSLGVCLFALSPPPSAQNAEGWVTLSYLSFNVSEWTGWAT
jgi:hypothetical protein